MATKSTKSAASKGSTASALGEDVQHKLFQKLNVKIKKEFNNAHEKLIKQYGKDPYKKAVLEKYHDKALNDFTKRFEKVKCHDTKKVQKEFKSSTDKMLKEAGKVDKEVRGVDTSGSKTSKKGRDGASAASIASKDGVGVKSTMSDAITKSQKYVDDYIKACETGVVPSDGWWSSFKRFFGFGS